MAKRRMFNLDIIDTDLFIEMPQTSRLLYYELCMRADDDGFVGSPKKIQKIVGCSDDDFKVLISKQFIIPFDSGIVVIRHWKIHNYIRGDRYNPTIYKQEQSLLNKDEDGIYSLGMTSGIPNVNQTVTQMDTQVRLGKVSIGKDSIGNNIYGQNEAEILPLWETQFIDFYDKYPKKVKKQDVKKWFQKNKPSSELFDLMMDSLNKFIFSKEWQKENGQFIPYPTTWLNQKRWEDENIEIKMMSALQRAWQKGENND